MLEHLNGGLTRHTECTVNQATTHHTTTYALATLDEVPSTFMFDGKAVRVINRGGSALFVARDLSRALGIDNTTAMLRPLDEDEKGTVMLDDDEFRTFTSSKGARARAVVTEGGMYTVVLRSRKATEPGSVAYRFRRWVTDVVLPTIRQTGSYVVPAAPVPAPIDPMAMLQDLDVLIPLLANMAQRAKVAEAAVEAARPAVDFVQALADSDGTWGLQAAAKALHQGPNKFIAWLKDRGDLFERNGGNVALQSLIDRGVYQVVWQDYGGKPRPTTKLTGKGVVHYARLLGVKPPAAPAQALLPGF